MKWDVFISHASEDKRSFVAVLAEELRGRGLAVWYDDFVLQPGDSLRQSIDQGLAESRCGVVILSDHFFRKKWPQVELDGLVALARSPSSVKRIIPVWHGVSHSDVASYSPTLADLVALDASNGLSNIAEKIIQIVQRECSGTTGRQRTDNARSRPIDSDMMSVLKRRAKLQEICAMAVTMNEEALLGTPDEYKSNFPEEHAPFAPDNMYKWQEAAQLGIADGQYLFGVSLDNVGETTEAKQWLDKAAAEGHLLARRALGEILLNRDDPQRGLCFLIEAGNAGDAVAWHLLARRYKYGEGVPKSKKKAREYERKAAKLGHFRAQLLLRD